MRPAPRILRFLWPITLLAACTSTEVPDAEDNNGGSGPTGGAGTGGATPTAGTAPAAGTGGVAGTAPQAGTAGAPPTAGAGAGGTPAGAGSAGAPPAGGAGIAGAGGDLIAGGAGAGGAAAGSAGAGGAGAGGAAAGGAGAGGTSAGSSGTSGAAGSGGGSATPCPDGCAEASVPFTAWNSSQSFEIYFNSATDLSTATITARVRKVAGKAGGLQIFAKNGSAQNYAYVASSWNEVNTLTSTWTDLSMEVASGTAGEDPFDATMVTIIALQLGAGDPWYTDETETMEDPTALVNPTVIQIDEISITGTGTYPGPYPFTTSLSPLTANVTAEGLAATPPYAVEGSTAVWVGP
jgi:hypothetical protein